jgi:hypothetical protein
MPIKKPIPKSKAAPRSRRSENPDQMTIPGTEAAAPTLDVAAELAKTSRTAYLRKGGKIHMLPRDPANPLRQDDMGMAMLLMICRAAGWKPGFRISTKEADVVGGSPFYRMCWNYLAEELSVEKEWLSPSCRSPRNESKKKGGGPKRWEQLHQWFYSLMKDGLFVISTPGNGRLIHRDGRPRGSATLTAKGIALAKRFLLGEEIPGFFHCASEEAVRRPEARSKVPPILPESFVSKFRAEALGVADAAKPKKERKMSGRIIDAPVALPSDSVDLHLKIRGDLAEGENRVETQHGEAVPDGAAKLGKQLDDMMNRMEKGFEKIADGEGVKSPIRPISRPVEQLIDDVARILMSSGFTVCGRASEYYVRSNAPKTAGPVVYWTREDELHYESGAGSFGVRVYAGNSGLTAEQLKAKLAEALKAVRLSPTYRPPIVMFELQSTS